MKKNADYCDRTQHAVNRNISLVSPFMWKDLIKRKKEKVPSASLLLRLWLIPLVQVWVWDLGDKLVLSNVCVLGRETLWAGRSCGEVLGFFPTPMFASQIDLTIEPQARRRWARLCAPLSQTLSCAATVTWHLVGGLISISGYEKSTKKGVNQRSKDVMRSGQRP